MPSKHLLPVLLALLAPLALSGGLIKTEKLKSPIKKYSMLRNLFYPTAPSPAAGNPSTTTTPLPEIKKTIEEEIRQSIKYEGFTSKDAKKMAVLNISGEYHFPFEGDVVLDKIKIVKITETSVTVEYENQTIEIFLEKGSNNG